MRKGSKLNAAYSGLWWVRVDDVVAWWLPRGNIWTFECGRLDIWPISDSRHAGDVVTTTAMHTGWAAG